MDRSKIRNFSIIAHIDHGKSTLADRLLEFTGALEKRELQAQFLDNLDLERERGITIKAQTVRLNYKAKDGETYQIHLIDTPGHVDFHYEVSRSLAACEGALLVVDATQGVEAQTLANVYVAIDNNLEILPVINKIDLPSADIPKVKREIEEIIGLDTSNALEISAKTGIGIEEVLEAVVKYIPPPTRGDFNNPLRALVYDSWFDPYQGVVVLVRVFDGSIRPGDKIRFVATGGEYEVYKVGVFTPHRTEIESIDSGQAGYVAATIRNLRDVKIGDTLTVAGNTECEPLPGFKVVKPAVFGGLFPIDADEYQNVKSSLEKLALNDASFTYEPETSAALGFGFRCGYLGLLHMEIIQERLEREFNLSLITTAPSVQYRVTLTNQEIAMVDNPADFPDVSRIAQIEEPLVHATVHCPKEYVGSILKLCEDKRGKQLNLTVHGETRAMIVYELPLSEIVLDFHDRLKSLTKGYASFDYELSGYRIEDLVKLDIKLNGDIVDALSAIVHRDDAYVKGRDLCEKLKDLLDQQMFDIAVQASIGSKIISRSTVRALRKNVTAKCYGGDISRKRKLLDKQKEGKKRMKQVGKVAVSQDAFLAILKVGE